MNDADNMRYALAKQIPSIERGCTIQTNYGDIHLYGQDAAAVAALLQTMFEKKLRQAAHISGCAHCED